MEIKLGENLAKLIQASRKSIKTVALEIGIPYQTLHDYTTKGTGSKGVNPEYLRKLCLHFKVSSDWLLFSIKPKEKIITDKLRTLLEEIE